MAHCVTCNNTLIFGAIVSMLWGIGGVVGPLVSFPHWQGLPLKPFNQRHRGLRVLRLEAADHVEKHVALSAI
jgi:hypothetical protein